MSVDVDGANLPIVTAHSSMPRIDVIGRRDDVVFARRGTPTSGANLSNLLGAQACAEEDRLGWVLVPAGEVAITAAHIRVWDAALEARLHELEREVAHGR